MNLDPYYIVNLDPELDSVTAFRRLSHRPNCVFLDSARRRSPLSQYSFVAADPFELIVGNESSSLDRLESALERFSGKGESEFPTPLPSGAIGYFAYDMARCLETIPLHRYDEFELPHIFFGLYDVVLTFDHVRNRSYLVSSGYPALDPQERKNRARERANLFLSWLDSESVKTEQANTSSLSNDEFLLAPQFDTPHEGIMSNFDAERYRDMIRQGIEYIHAGDVFQVNLAQRLLCRASSDSRSLYLRLRQHNAAPFSCYFDLGEQQIISASPERFLSVQERVVETRPIKGTRPRQILPEADLFSGAELAASGKDLAENVMIVDLMRNDLSRVCVDHSIRVDQLCGLETYEHVQHLVSVIRGQLRDSLTVVDLVRCTFPGGSITGAPKIRSMEIIAELEPTVRGAYCGSLGYLSFSGNLDLNILIRTITASRGWWQFPVGGGIVADSDPQAELDETWAKAEGILQAVLELPR